MKGYLIIALSPSQVWTFSDGSSLGLLKNGGTAVVINIKIGQYYADCASDQRKEVAYETSCQ
jgi:hypothetical protein